MTGTVAIIGGIAGLALALNLHRRAIACTVCGAVPEMREIGGTCGSGQGLPSRTGVDRKA